MSIKELSTGLQHIGIPTKDIDKSREFYEKLGFEVTYSTTLEENNQKVIFLKLHELILEIYEGDAKMAAGAIDHIALNVTDIDKAYEAVKEAGLLGNCDGIHFLPFFENGVKYFSIPGPNCETVEFNQYL